VSCCSFWNGSHPSNTHVSRSRELILSSRKFDIIQAYILGFYSLGKLMKLRVKMEVLWTANFYIEISYQPFHDLIC
jgi:hypothetical protein